MPIATPEIYADMLDRAKAGGFAYPAINVTSSETVNAALRGFADAGSDGIIQVSTGGAEFASGTGVKEMVTGAVALAEFAHVVAAKYDDQRRAAHRPLPEGQARQLRPPAARDLARSASTRGKPPLFQSHMWDGSAIELEENLQIAAELLEQGRQRRTSSSSSRSASSAARRTASSARSTRSSTRRRTTRCAPPRRSAPARRAATCWPPPSATCTASYKPGNVKLRPEILKEIQDAVGAKVGKDKPFDLVFHGGSGSELEEIREALSYGVVKMNVDTDTQYAFTREIAGHMFTNYDGVLKVDGEVGNKKAYDPRST